MGETTDSKILLIVENAKAKAEKAHSEFKRSYDKLKEKTKNTIDLLDPNALSQVSDIASSARIACDTLYAEYQTLVIMVNSQCQPLLEHNPDCKTIREVYNLIKDLNESSEIENNFTASFNDNNLGDIANARYFVPIESKIIQSFWQVTYENHPDRLDIEKQEAQKRKEEQEKAHLESKDYDQIVKDWHLKIDSIVKCRSEKASEYLKEKETAKNSEIEKAYTDIEKAILAEKTECNKKKAEAKEALSTLGFFEFSEKKALKTIINDMNNQIENADSRLLDASQTLQRQKEDLDEWLEIEKFNIEQAVKKEIPLPELPKKPSSYVGTPKISISNEIIGEMIVNSMHLGISYSESDFTTSIPALDGMESKASSILRSMMGVYVKKTKDCCDSIGYQVIENPRLKFTKKQIEKNDILYKDLNSKQRAIVENMSPETWYTVSELALIVPEITDMSNIQISALVNSLLDIYLERKEGRRVAYFKLINNQQSLNNENEF